MSRAMNLGYTQNFRTQQCQLVMLQAPREGLFTFAESSKKHFWARMALQGLSEMSGA